MLEMIMYNELRDDLTKLANKYDDVFHGSADADGAEPDAIEKAYCLMLWRIDEKIRELYKKNK